MSAPQDTAATPPAGRPKRRGPSMGEMPWWVEKLAIPIAFLGKLLGAKLIYVENGARVRTPSRSGRLMYRVADLFFVQWPELKGALPEAIFAGSLHG